MRNATERNGIREGIAFRILCVCACVCVRNRFFRSVVIAFSRSHTHTYTHKHTHTHTKYTGAEHLIKPTFIVTACFRLVAVQWSTDTSENKTNYTLKKKRNHNGQVQVTNSMNNQLLVNPIQLEFAFLVSEVALYRPSRGNAWGSPCHWDCGIDPGFFFFWGPCSILTANGISIPIPIRSLSRRHILLKHLSAAQSVACVNELFWNGERGRGTKFNVTNFWCVLIYIQTDRQPDRQTGQSRAQLGGSSLIPFKRILLQRITKKLPNCRLQLNYRIIYAMLINCKLS